MIPEPIKPGAVGHFCRYLDEGHFEILSLCYHHQHRFPYHYQIENVYHRHAHECHGCTLEKRWPESWRRWTVAQMTERSQQTGGHWFDPDTRRRFSSRIYDIQAIRDSDGLILFISSEADRIGPYSTWAWGGQRRYTLRAFNPYTGTISEPESTPDQPDLAYYGRYPTLRQARAALKQLLRPSNSATTRAAAAAP